MCVCSHSTKAKPSLNVSLFFYRSSKCVVDTLLKRPKKHKPISYICCIATLPSSFRYAEICCRSSGGYVLQSYEMSFVLNTFNLIWTSSPTHHTTAFCHFQHSPPRLSPSVSVCRRLQVLAPLLRRENKSEKACEIFLRQIPQHVEGERCVCAGEKRMTSAG